MNKKTYVAIYVPTGMYIARGSKEFVEYIALRSQLVPFVIKVEG